MFGCVFFVCWFCWVTENFKTKAILILPSVQSEAFFYRDQPEARVYRDESGWSFWSIKRKYFTDLDFRTMTKNKPTSLPSFEQLCDYFDMGIIRCFHCGHYYRLDSFIHEHIGMAIFEFYDSEDQSTRVVHAGNLCHHCVNHFLSVVFPGPTTYHWKNKAMTYYPVPSGFWTGQTITETDENQFNHIQINPNL
jgi:hypothetical protein